MFLCISRRSRRAVSRVRKRAGRCNSTWPRVSRAGKLKTCGLSKRAKPEKAMSPMIASLARIVYIRVGMGSPWHTTTSPHPTPSSGTTSGPTNRPECLPLSEASTARSLNWRSLRIPKTPQIDMRAGATSLRKRISRLEQIQRKPLNVANPN